MEVVWKLVLVIINFQFTAYIIFHDILHGFRVGCGTGTTTLEAKLLQQLEAMNEDIIYVIFMDLHKVYDALDKYICLYILEGYGGVPQSLRILR